MYWCSGLRRGCDPHHLHQLIINSKTIRGKHRANHEIRNPQVRVIDEKGEQLGVLDTRDAIARAQERGLDLVEVSANADPPVCKIINLGAHQYQQSKAAQKQKSKGRASELKGIRISFKIGQHDLDMKVNQARKFLERGDRVKLELILRGRENQFKEKAREKIEQFISSINEGAYQDGKISKAGNRLSTIIGMKK